MTNPRLRVDDLLATYGARDACVAELLCDRHPQGAVAFTVVEPDLSVRQLTCGELRERSRLFAAGLAELGVEPGDRVATLMAKSVDLVTVLLGIWRRGAVHVPLFTAFAPPAIAMRLTGSQAKVVVVDADQRAKLSAEKGMLANAGWQIVVAGNPAEGDRSVDALLAAAQPDDPRAESVAVGGDAEFIRLFTSGTTGAPKGVSIPVRAIASFVTYLEYGLGVESDDVFWNAADPGWAFGLYYGIVAPLATGHPNVLLHAGFSAELTFRVLSRLKVTNFTAAPTVFRVLRGQAALLPDDLVLRRCSSAGEPLNPESMGHALPGWSVEVLRADRDEIAPPGELGRVAVDLANSPLMWFTGYANEPEKTAERFTPDGRWYLTGDAGSKDGEGYVFFSARDDDVIIMAGYRISPFDIENVLLTHP